MKSRAIGDSRNLFDHEEEQENYYRPVRVSNFWSNNHIECKGNSDSNKTLSVKEYLNKIKSYLKHMKNNLKKSGTWKLSFF